MRRASGRTSCSVGLRCAPAARRGDVAALERPDLQEKKESLVIQIADGRRRIKELERKLPRAATVEVPGPWAGEVTVSTQGQLAVQRVVQGRFPNPLAKVAEFGVVGTFELVPEAR